MKIKLNSHIDIDLPKLIDSRLLIQANSGGGKSYAIRRIIEQAFGKVQIIVLDPEGEFVNLREKFDFVYAGKGGDAPVEARSATLLAHRLLELKASAIIDLYELQPQERRHFVRLFCEAMVNAPKELWHDCLVIIDEAHVFAPEKGESEALGAVIDLATRGRKRGYCAVLATQRLPKLNKDAAAECNNKLIGRASQDIDRKRASEELGFTTKEQILSLRDLNPGEFYIFGPAISREVIKTTIGDVQVKPPVRGSARSFKAPPPSTAVKKILAELKDLPQEAQKEAKTVAELKAALTSSKQELSRLKHETQKPIVDLYSIEKAHEQGREEGKKEFVSKLNKYSKAMMDIAALAHPFTLVETISVTPTAYIPPQKYDFTRMPYKPIPYEEEQDKVIGKGELLVLSALAQHSDGMTREHITVQTGYKRSTRDAYIQRLAAREFVQILPGGKICATVAGIEAAPKQDPLPTGQELIEYYIRTLPSGEAKVFEFLSVFGPQDRDTISERTGFKRSTRDAYIQRLMTRQLVVQQGSMIRISEFIYGEN